MPAFNPTIDIKNPLPVVFSSLTITLIALQVHTTTSGTIRLSYPQMYLLSIVYVSVAFAMPFLHASQWDHVSDIANTMSDVNLAGGGNATQTNGSYCGEDLVQLNKVIALQLSTSLDQLQTLRLAFNSSNQLDGVMANLTELNTMVVAMAQNLALINWSCVSNDLSIELATVMNNSLLQVEYFLLAVLHHLMQGNKLVSEWPLVLGIPSTITEALEQVSGAVVVVRLTVWREVLNVRMLISLVAKSWVDTSV